MTTHDAESRVPPRRREDARRALVLSCGNRVGTNRKTKPKRIIGTQYDSVSYRKAVRYAITAARKAIRKAGGDPDKQLPYWTPYQLRHTHATKVRK